MKLELRLLLFSNYLNFFGSGLFLPLYALFVQQMGGNVFHAGASLELETKKNIVTPENYIDHPQKMKKIEKK